MATGRLIGAFAIAMFAALAAAPACAQSVAEFYTGKVVTVYIGYPAGGGYDVYGRLVAHHIGKHIPGNPTVIAVNMEGAGSLRLANWLYNAAPKDGTAFGIVNHGVPFEELLGNHEFAQFDATKFTWIGSANDETAVCVAWHSAGVTSVDELYDKELIVGSTGPGADDFVFPRLLAGVIGAHLRFVSGYAGGADINFAMERGEVDGRCGWTWSSVKSTRGQWLQDGSINVLVQFATEKHPDLQDVPLIMDYAKNEEERQVLRLIMMRGTLGRPFLAPPDLPPDRAAALQHAFDEMTTDPEYIAEAEEARLEIRPTSGAALQQLMVEAKAMPPHLVERARAILQ